MDLLKNYSLVDLTHVLHEQIPTWSGGCGFRLEIKLDYDQGLRVQSLKSHAGVGTHIDAPSHFISGGRNIGDIPLEQLIVPACILDVRAEMAPDFFVRAGHIDRFEKQIGPIPPNALFIAWTGWDQFWSHPDKYRNPDAAGRMHFPGFAPDAAKALLQRNIAGIGIDTLSPDGSTNGAGVRYPVHELVLGANKYIIENLTQLHQMPPLGAYAIALPPKARDATETGARVVGLVPK